MTKRALVSVSDKTGVLELCKELVRLNYEIISTGGTAKTLREAGLTIKEVSDITGFPEILDGRVKTLHPKVFGGLLARRGDKTHDQDLKRHAIEPFDVAVVNLYPFEKVLSEKNLDEKEMVEYIDIGGVTLIRAAAKNFEGVVILCDPADYAGFLKELEDERTISLDRRRRYAAKAFAHTARYDSVISAYFRERIGGGEPFPEELTVGLRRIQPLRYGENPHQRAALYLQTGSGSAALGLVSAKQLQGKELSYNNYLDLESAWNQSQEFQTPCCAIIKHNNPCGVASANRLVDAYKQALACDPISAFGGVIAFNKEVDLTAAEELLKLFVECVIAPGFRPDALNAFKQKPNVRILVYPSLLTAPHEMDFRRISGGFLVQDRDYQLTAHPLKGITKRAATAEEQLSLDFAWRVAKHVKSNTIVLVKGQQTVGIGAGQMSRIDALKIAAIKMNQMSPSALDAAHPLVMASDAFFPFRDCVDEAAKIGVSAVVQPGGSLRDQESIDAANTHGMAMLLTGMRHFRH